VKKLLIRFGHSELVENLMSGTTLAEYISALLPETVGKYYPDQYCANKMICMYIERCLTLAAETQGRIRDVESLALESYRAERLFPRIKEFFEYTVNEQYRNACAATGNYTPVIELLVHLSTDMKRLCVKTEKRAEQIYELMQRYYLLCLPVYKESIVANVIAILSRADKGGSVC